MPHRLHISGSVFVQCFLRRTNNVIDLIAQHQTNRFVQPAARVTRLGQCGVALKRLIRIAIEQRHFANLVESDEARPHAVVDVVRVVGNFIGQVAQLRLQAGLLAQQKPRPHAALAIGKRGLSAFQHFCIAT